MVDVREPSDADGAPAAVDVDLESGPFVKKSGKAITLIVFGLNLSTLSPLVQFLILTSGVFIFFVLCGSLEENMFNNVPGFNFGWYMTMFELIGFSCLALIERRLSLGPKDKVLDHRAPFKAHFIVALSMTFARGLTNMSLQYLNYPSQVIFKSLKLISVIAASIVIYGKRYSLQELVSCCFLVLAAILFTLGDVAVSPRFNWKGVGIVVTSLFFDAVHSNSQEHVLQANNAPMLELMIFGNVFASGLSFVINLVTGELMEAFAFCSNHLIIYVYFMLRICLVYAGVLCFVGTIKRFGVVAATTVTTVRKILSVIVSFILFPKPFSTAYVVACIVFCLGTWLNLRSKQSLKQRNSEKGK